MPTASVSIDPSTFGIVGNFDGDEKLLQELNWCCQTFAAKDTTKPPLARLVALLEALPHKGRIAVVYECLKSSPHRDAILRDLFDFCFLQDASDDDDVRMETAEDENGDDSEEFVWIQHPNAEETPRPLNLAKYHLFQVVLPLMSVSGAAGVEMSRKYLDMASSKYRGQVLMQCAKFFDQHLYPDNELFEQYQLSSAAVQYRLVQVCKRCKHRKTFLQLLFAAQEDKGDDDPHEIVYSLGKDDFSRALSKHIWPPDKEPRKTIKHWGAHGDAYLQELRSRLQAHSGDSLKQGGIYLSFQQSMELTSVLPRHVEAILQIFQDFQLCQTQKSLRKETCEYLENLSSQGQDVSNFEGVEPVRIHFSLLKKLTQKQRKELVLQCLQQGDFDAFCNVYRLVPLHSLPYQDVLAKASSQELQLILDHSSSDDSIDPFLQFFCQEKDALFTGAANGVERAAVVEAWCQWHLRCLPSSMTNHTGQPMGQNMWGTWYQSFNHFFTSSAVNHALGLLTSSPWWDRRIPAYSSYAEVLIKLAVQGFQAVGGRVEKKAAIDPLITFLHIMPLPHVSKNENVQSLATTTVQVISDILLPALSAMMQFDAALPDNYISDEKSQYFQRTFQTILGHWSSSPQVTQVAAKILLDVYARAKYHRQECPKFAIASPPRKKRRFVYYNYNLHESVEQACGRLARRLLELAREFPMFDNTVQLWDLVSRQEKFSVESNFRSYMTACYTCLPKSLLEAEESTMERRAEAFILYMVRLYPSRWENYVSLDCLLWPKLVEKVVASSDNISEKVGDVLITLNAGFTNEQARQALKDKTFDKDADSRILGLIEWLSQAFATRDVWHISNAMSFVVSRIKNEPGNRRRTFFDRLNVDFVTKVVQASLEDRSQKARVHETLANAVLLMQQNDLARQDSVARYSFFPSIPNAILDSVLRFDPKRVCLERRQLWANCAIRLHWEYLSCTGGEEKLSCYSWPLYDKHQLETASWVSLEEFQAVYADASSDNHIQSLSKSVTLAEFLHENFDPKNVFGPTQCVSILEKALGTVWDKNLPSCSLRLLSGSFPEREEVAEAWLDRLLTLFELCGTSWQESDLLTSIFDNIFGGIDDISHSLHHIQFASRLLSSVYTRDERCNCRIPRLATACDKIFRAFVAKDDDENATFWLSYWMKLQNGRWCQDIVVGDRLANFLSMYASGCEPKMWRKAISNKDAMFQECETVSKLLGMSQNAIFIPEVLRTLVAQRQDILLRCLRNTDDRQEVFLPDVLYETVNEMLFYCLCVDDLTTCHSEISQRVAKFACEAASDSKLDLRAKIDAVETFMKAPSTQHDDVLAMLNCELDDAVREALINRIFELDAPWFILGFLFNQDSIGKNDERVTAGLLGYIGKHVHSEKADRLGAILLKDSRRKKLTVQLHKSVVRMLFDSNTAVAGTMLQTEWSKELPDSVRIVIAERCIQLVVDGRATGWEHKTVLTQVARSQSYSTELKYCLFAPCWWGFSAAHCRGGISIAEADNVTPDDFLVEFNEKGPATIEVSSASVVSLFRTLLFELERSSEGPMQFLARLKRLSLSNLYSKTSPSDNQGVLDELADSIKLVVNNCSSHQAQIGLSFYTTLFAEGVLNVLEHDFQNVRQLLPQEFYRCLNHPVSVQFQEACRFLLNLILDLPIRQAEKRAVVLKTMKQLVNVARYSAFANALYRTPLQEDRTILKKDSQLFEAIAW